MLALCVVLCDCRASWFSSESSWRVMDEISESLTESSNVLAKLLRRRSLRHDLKGMSELHKTGGIFSAIAGVRLEERSRVQRLGILGALAKASLTAYDGAFPGREYLVDMSVAAPEGGDMEWTFVERLSGFKDGGNPFDLWVNAKDKVIILAFRGSHTPQDWVSNMFLARNTVGEHMGFDDALHSMKESLREVSQRYPRPWRVLLTGHSRGGALALLAAELFYRWSGFEHDLLGDDVLIVDGGEEQEEMPGVTPPIVAGVVTFGQPRVGDENFCERVEQLLGRRYLRVVNGGDVIPRLPAGGSYCHPAELPFLLIDFESGRLRWVDGEVDDVANGSDNDSVEASIMRHIHVNYARGLERAIVRHSKEREGGTGTSGAEEQALRQLRLVEAALLAPPEVPVEDAHSMMLDAFNQFMKAMPGERIPHEWGLMQPRKTAAFRHAEYEARAR